MGKITEWESEYEGKTYAFSHEKVNGSHVLKINGEVVIIKPGIKSVWLRLDEPFVFDGKEARLVMENKLPDVAVAGTFLKSGKPYEALAMPDWLWGFFLLLLPLVFFGGGAGGICVAAGALVCQKISLMNKPKAARMLLCAAVTSGAWLVWAGFSGVLAGIFAAITML